MKPEACALLLVCACDARVTTLGSYRIGSDAEVLQGQYLEAEAGQLSGYQVAADARASAGEFVAPPSGSRADTAPGVARASYSFEVPRAGHYVIWVRMRGPDTEHNRFWFQLDAEAFLKMRLSTGEAWFWNALHDDTNYDRPIDFTLEAGAHTLRLANCVDGVGVDRIYITSGDETPLGDDTPCKPPHSIERAGECVDSCGSHGKTDCGRSVCRGRPAVEAYDCEVCCVVP